MPHFPVDSKKLSEEQRKSLLEKIRSSEEIGWKIQSISAKKISSLMLQRTPISLNIMSIDAAMSLIETVINAGVRLEEVYIDTIGDPMQYQQKLDRYFNESNSTNNAINRGWRIHFTVAKQADSLYKPVAAASIIAKVTRDLSIEDWVFEEPSLRQLQEVNQGDIAIQAEPNGDKQSDNGEGNPASEVAHDDVLQPTDTSNTQDLARKRHRDHDSNLASIPETRASIFALGLSKSGSGYPSDPLTSEWLVNTFEPIFGWPTCVRFSWAPAKEALKKSEVQVLWPDSDNGQTKLSFRPISKDTNKEIHQSNWRKQKSLNYVVEL